MSFLHLTNGTAIIPMMRAAGIVGRIVPWDDVLHEGPVPAGLNLGAMRETRANFLASCGWGSREAIVRDLAERDVALESLQGVEEIILWFEHDLYDQLQVLQILDRLRIDGGLRVTAVPDDDYLGTQPVGRFGALFGSRREVTSSQRIAARDAWEAFRSADPRAIVDAIQRVTDLPHLPAALRRHLQQFPSLHNGLSRTEQQGLEAVARGVSLVSEVFTQANHQSEEAVFMGDAAFLVHIRGLMQGPRPLMRVVKARSQGSGAEAPLSASPDMPSVSVNAMSLDDTLALLEDGRRVLAGDADRVALCGINRWLGGVHLRGRGPVWRYDHGRQAIRFA